MAAQHTSHVVIIGGGVMGGDIAVVFAAAGWTVHVMSPSAPTREALPGRVAAGLQKLPPATATGAVISYGRLEDVPWADVQFVIETVTENLALKQRLFTEIEALAPRDIPITSNTSNFPISTIAGSLVTRSRMLGLHFFMPAHLVPLVEVVSADFTDPAVAGRTEALMKILGKAPIRVNKDVPGFVGNRLQHAMLREALYLLAEGVTDAAGIDTAVRYGFGFRFIACGPMMQKEMSGWDTTALVSTALYPHLHAEQAPPAFLREMVAQGKLGMKTGRGMWEWTDESAAQEKARIDHTLQAALALLRKNPS